MRTAFFAVIWAVLLLLVFGWIAIRFYWMLFWGPSLPLLIIVFLMVFFGGRALLRSRSI